MAAVVFDLRLNDMAKSTENDQGEALMDSCGSGGLASTTSKTLTSIFREIPWWYSPNLWFRKIEFSVWHALRRSTAPLS